MVAKLKGRKEVLETPRGTASPRAPSSLGRPKGTSPPLGKRLLPHGLCLGWSRLCQCVCLGSDAIFSPVSVSRLLSLSRSGSTCVCVRARVRLHFPLAVWESVSEPSSLSASESPDPRPLTGALALADELAPACCLPSPGCERVSVCVCPCACLSLVRSPGKVLCLAGGVGTRRGGAAALQAPAAAGPEARHLRGHLGLSSEPEGWVGDPETSAPPSPRPPAQACTPDRPLRVPETLRAPGLGQACGPGLLVYGGGAASAGLPALAGAPRGKVRPAGSTGTSERKRGAAQGF